MTILRTLDGVPDRAKVADVTEANSQFHVKSVIAACNAGADSVIGTVSTAAVIAKSIIIHADAAQHANLTSCPVHGGAAKCITFIAAADAIQANLDAENTQLSWEGEVYLPVGATIVMVHNGAGAAPLDLTVTVEYLDTDGGGVIS